MSESREELEARADRFRRRGELAAALALYQQLAASHPDDAALAAKMAELGESLQPMELMHPKAALGDSPAIGPEEGQAEQEGERLFAEGDYAGAAAAYRRALENRPESELIRERLLELYQLAKSAQAPSHPLQPLLEALLTRIAARRGAGER